MRARTCADAVAMSRGGGPSQYYPGVDNEALERKAIAEGEVTRGDPIQAVLKGAGFHTRYDAGSDIGASNGTPVSTVRAEYSSRTIHGHPRDF
jgi:hypothetical protein